MTTIKTSVKAFRDEYLEHIIDKRCRAGVCQGMIEYRVRSQNDPDMPAAAEICPTAAIVGEPGSYSVDDPLCIRCGACKEVAPNGMEVLHRFPLEVSEGGVAAGG
jgi:Fe-S-cluster-containing hydrogenase component 2